MPKVIRWSVELRNVFTLTGAFLSFVGASIVGTFLLYYAYRYSTAFPTLTKDAGILAVTVSVIGALAVMVVGLLIICSLATRKRLGNMVKCQLFGICCVTSLSTLIALALFSRAYVMDIQRVKKLMAHNLELNIYWDRLQQDMKCCGTGSSGDWNGTVPDSCCPSKHCNNNNYFKNGCYEAVEDQLTHYSLLLIIFLTLALIFQLACVINIVQSMVGDLSRRSSAGSGRR